MKNFLLWGIKAIIAGLAALLLLCLWCSFYYNVPVHYANESGATEYKWESHRFYRKGTEGFAFGRTNNDGFNNLRDYEAGEKIDILLMGSSHMEGMNTPQRDNAAAVLNRLFDGEKYTYNIGASGHTLMYCLKHLESALETYSPQGYAVIETRTLNFSETELAATADGTLPDIPSHNGGLIGLMQRMPYLRLLYTKYIKDSADGGEDAAAEEPAREDVTEKERLLNRLLAGAAEHCKGRGVELILVYDPTVYVDGEGKGYTKTGDEDLAMFARCCTENKICFIDLTEAYLKGYHEQHKLPYGFANTSPGNGHMNSWGHALFAQAVFETIQETEG